MERKLSDKHTSTIISLATISLVLLIGAILTGNNMAFAAKFTALMSGDQEVPPVDTTATGKTTFRTSNNDTSMKYKVNITGFSNASAAHIHLGKAGANGDVIVDLLTGMKKNPTKVGMAIRGNITDSSLTGPMQGKTITDLITAINSGDTYVNVHTQSHPDGEIRGQIQPGDGGSRSQPENATITNTANESSTG
jgi:CHRD domain-containing protein